MAVAARSSFSSRACAQKVNVCARWTRDRAPLCGLRVGAGAVEDRRAQHAQVVEPRDLKTELAQRRLPKWLDRVLPNIAVEGSEGAAVPMTKLDEPVE
jgi:hypothetical protein